MFDPAAMFKVLVVHENTICHNRTQLTEKGALEALMRAFEQQLQAGACAQAAQYRG